MFDCNIHKNTHIFMVGRLRGGTSQAPINMETPEGRNEFQTQVTSWYTDTMVKMQGLEEEKDELKKVIDEERSKHKEAWGYDVCCKVGARTCCPNCSGTLLCQDHTRRGAGSSGTTRDMRTR